MQILVPNQVTEHRIMLQLTVWVIFPQNRHLPLQPLSLSMEENDRKSWWCKRNWIGQETNTFPCANSGFPPESLGCNTVLSFNCLFLASVLRLDENSMLTPKQRGIALS